MLSQGTEHCTALTALCLLTSIVNFKPTTLFQNQILCLNTTHKLQVLGWTGFLQPTALRAQKLDAIHSVIFYFWLTETFFFPNLHVPRCNLTPAELPTELAGERHIWILSTSANTQVFDHLQWGCSCFDHKWAFLDHTTRIKKPDTSILPSSDAWVETLICLIYWAKILKYNLVQWSGISLFSEAAFPFILLIPAVPVPNTVCSTCTARLRSIAGRIPPTLQEKQRSFQKYTLSSD